VLSGITGGFVARIQNDPRIDSLPGVALTPDGARVTAGTTVEVPPGCRRVLLRQRLHALVIGQRPGETLLTVSGSRVSALCVATLTGTTPPGLGSGAPTRVLAEVRARTAAVSNAARRARTSSNVSGNAWGPWRVAGRTIDVGLSAGCGRHEEEDRHGRREGLRSLALPGQVAAR
jgi:hypothetical protein